MPTATPLLSGTRFGAAESEATAMLPEGLRRFLSLVPETLAVVRSQALPSFWIALLVGGALAVVGWLGAVYFARLWNRRYCLPPWQHALCGVAALITFVAVPVWAAASYIKNTTDAVSGLWQDQLGADETWQQATYAVAYENVRRLNVEDFSGVPRPDQPGSRIPLTDSASVRAVAEVYARRAAARFRNEYPRLSAFVRQTGSGRVAHLDTWTHIQAAGALRPLTQPARKAVSTAVARVLDPVRLWVWRVRLTTGSLFFAAHLLTFGVVGTLAVRDIRVHT